MTKIICSLLLLLSSFIRAEEKPFVIIIPSYNNYNWADLNISSILNQKYSNYRVIYIDDHSSDGTKERVERLLKKNLQPSQYRSFTFQSNAPDDIVATTQDFCEQINLETTFFTLIYNQSRSGALANQYRAISSCSNDEIVVLIDGDDWLANNTILQKLNDAYSSENVWMTHGSLKEYPSGISAWCEPIPHHIINSNSFRSFKCPSHLRTFYASIFKRIRLEDLLYNGDFFPMTGDMAIMYPIIEMCRERHRFISEPVYVYNMRNPINDNKVNPELQRQLDRLIREKTPYSRLEHR